MHNCQTSEIPLLLMKFMDPCTFCPLFCVGMLGKSTNYSTGQRCQKLKIIGGASSNGWGYLPSTVGIGLTDLPNIGEAIGPPGPPVPASLLELSLSVALFELNRTI